MKTQSKNLTNAEVEQFLDNYFSTLNNKLDAFVKQAFPVQALVLKTADDKNLEFGEEIQQSSQIEVGTEGVKIDGKLADGKFTMPSGVVLEIKEGKVTKIIQPTPEEIAARMRANVNNIRKDMADMRAQLKIIIVRKPYKRTGNCK